MNKQSYKGIELIGATVIDWHSLNESCPDLEEIEITVTPGEWSSDLYGNYDLDICGEKEKEDFGINTDEKVDGAKALEILKSMI